jgi:hypothetical protein
MAFTNSSREITKARRRTNAFVASRGQKASWKARFSLGRPRTCHRGCARNAWHTAAAFGVVQGADEHRWIAQQDVELQQRQLGQGDVVPRVGILQERGCRLMRGIGHLDGRKQDTCVNGEHGSQLHCSAWLRASSSCILRCDIAQSRKRDLQAAAVYTR